MDAGVAADFRPRAFALRTAAENFKGSEQAPAAGSQPNLTLNPTEPGQTMLTRIPSAAWSRASARHSISRPPLLAQ